MLYRSPHRLNIISESYCLLVRVQMFFLSLIEHKLRLPPASLHLPLNEGIKIELEKLFVDKVIADLGLCISVYDIKSIEGGDIVAGEGAPTYTVSFRLVMFRPYPGEIIIAKLKDSDSAGIQLSLGFFDDIYVPSSLLPQPPRYENDPENEYYNTWLWEQDEQDGNKFWIDGMCQIRFKVHAVTYPPLPIEQAANSKPFAPMKITGSIDGDGLGPISWWPDEEGNEEGETDDQEPN